MPRGRVGLAAASTEQIVYSPAVRTQLLTGFIVLGLTACGDDGGGSNGTETDTDTPATSTSTSTTTSTSSSSTTNDTTSSSSTTTDPQTTTTGPESSSTTDEPETSTGSGSTTTGGEEFDCTAIPAGPFAAEVQFRPAVFNGSEDLAFDGMGNLAGKDGPNVVLVDASGTEVASYSDPGAAYGLRYRDNGDLLVAHFQTGVIVQIAPDGSSSDFATGIGGVNGIYPDLDGNVWVTNFSVVGRYDGAGNYADIVTGGDASSANGIVYDPDRGFAFYTNYSAGRIRKVVIDGEGNPGAISDVATIPGTAMDGLSLDICGNIYAVDQGGSRLYRVFLDDAGEAVGEPENLIEGNINNIANAQFGRGGEFDEMSIYAAGVPGVVYRVEVGVPGAEIPLP